MFYKKLSYFLEEIATAKYTGERHLKLKSGRYRDLRRTLGLRGLQQ